MVMKKMKESFSMLQHLHGPVTLTEPAWKEYEERYNEHYSSSPFYIIPMLSGYASRWHTHMLTVATLLSASASPLQQPIVVTPRNIRAAIKTLESSELAMPKIVRLITATERGALGEILADYVYSRPKGIEKEALLLSVAHRVSSREFDEVMNTLVGAGRVRRVLGPSGVVYLTREERR